MFPGGPRRGNDVNPGLPFVIRENLWFPEILKNPWEKHGSQLAEPAARSGDPRRLPVCDDKLRLDPTQIPWGSLCFLVVPNIW